MRKFAKRSYWPSKAPICTAARSRSTSFTNTFRITIAFEAHVRRIVATYAHRRDVMAEALAEHMPEGVRVTRPAGGMFLWVTVPNVDTAELLKISAEMKVVFVPGVSFYPARDVHDGMRLNFSNSGEKSIHIGVERLGHAIRMYR